MATKRTSRRDFIRLASAGAAAIGLGIKSTWSNSTGTMGFTIPKLAAGQASVMGLACEPLEKVPLIR